jgi:hypothetical protein
MSDVTIIVATLLGAIRELEARETSLASIEKLKLKTLRLNLEAAREAAVTPNITPQTRHDQHAP